MYISNNYKLAEGATPDEGMTEIKCAACEGKFAVPSNVLKELPENPVCDSDACVEKAAKVAVANSEVDAETNKASDDVIAKATGA